MSLNWRHRLIARGFDAITFSGAHRWLAPLARGRGAILMFHHVRPAGSQPFQPNALLEITPDFLDRPLGLVHRLGLNPIPSCVAPHLFPQPGKSSLVASAFNKVYPDILIF